MHVLVVGGTGKVGGSVAAGLVAKGKRVSVMTRSAEKAAAIRGEVRGVVGDLERPETLPAAFEGADALFMATALAQNESEQGLAAVNAAKQAGVRRIVYVTVQQVEDFPEIPHFASKYPIMEAIRKSEIEHTFLAPNHFFQNDLLSEEALMEHGIYPHPIGDVGMSRVDVRDIADAAVHALVEPVHNGESYTIAGAEVLTASQSAEVWAKHLGRPVRYIGNDLEAWAQQTRNYAPEWMVHDLCIMYDAFQKRGLTATREDLEKQKRILGHEPRRFEDFVAEIATRWKTTHKAKGAA